MRFCVISPCAGLQKFSTLTKTHLLLSHVSNPIYWNFYRQRSDEGDLVILDNGAYEGKLDEGLLILRMAEVHPKVVILPDLVGAEPELSYHISLKFWNKFRDRIPSSIDWMYVPQMHDGTGEALDTMFYFLEKAVNFMDLKFVGLPRIFATNFHCRRASLVRLIKRRMPQVHVHALGMAAGSLQELQELADNECDSIDSSAPVWRGWNGHALKEGRDPQWDAVGTEVDWDVHPGTLTVENENLIKENLRKVGVKC